MMLFWIFLLKHCLMIFELKKGCSVMLVNAWMLYDNSGSKPTILAWGEKG